MQKIDSSLHKKFRASVEERLEVAQARNSRMIGHWTLSDEFDRVSLSCHAEFLDSAVIDHIGQSLTRLLGVGRKIGLVDSATRSITLTCSTYTDEDIGLERTYEIG